MMNKKVLQYLYNTFTAEFDNTMTRKFRDGRDIALPFLSANTAVTRFGATKDVSTKYFYMELSSNHTTNVKSVEKMLRTKMDYCGCIQDSLDGKPTDDAEIDYLTESLCKLFPEPSSFEKRGHNICLNYHKERTVIGKWSKQIHSHFSRREKKTSCEFIHTITLGKSKSIHEN